jgi:hypothetical protein
LFSFGDTSPAPAPPAAGADDDFSGFQSAGAGPSATSNDPFGGDPFAAGPTSAPTSTSSMGQLQPDPFAAQPQSFQQPASMNNINAVNNMFGNMSMGGAAGGMNPMMGGMNPMMASTMNPMMGAVNPMMGSNTMGVGMMGASNNVMGSGAANGMMGVGKPPAAAADFDDDFGDFEGASGGQTASTPAAQSKSSDPFGSLISLDGLSKNTKKEDKLNQPIVINAAAAQYMQDKQLGIGVAAPQDSAKSTAMSFAGIDGLQKSAPANSMGMGMGMGGGFGNMGMGGMSSPVAGGMNPNVMGSAGVGNASLIGALDPQLMTPQPPRQHPQGMAGMNPQQQQMMQMMMMQNPQMMQQMMANGGQMTPLQQQQMMQMMMMNQQQMMGGGVMGGGNNMMGGQGGQMGGQMGGQPMGGQPMGGQPMGGGGFGGF